MSPGWMPSRPRPLGQARRRIRVARTRAPRRMPPGPATSPRSVEVLEVANVAMPSRPGPPPPVSDAPDGGSWMCSHALAFAEHRLRRDAARTLPVARLLRRQSDGPRHVTGALHRWLGRRWQWVQPRMIPLIAAFFGLIGVLNARRYLMELARGPAVVCPAPDAVQLGGHLAPGHVVTHHPAACPVTPPHAPERHAR